MNLEEHYRQNYWNLPKPNEVINLKEIDKIKFFNISYREYVGVYGDYIIGVYPFAIKIDKSFKDDGSPITYGDFKMYGVKSKHHHVDFTEGKIDTDPCDIYEKVSGVKIHHGEPDNHMMNIYHEDDIKLFEAEIISQRRDSKLNELGI
jgi:hypothetical protein